MRYEQEKERKIAALDAEFTPHSRRDRMTLAIMAN